jgi:hypothetical protein
VRESVQGPVVEFQEVVLDSLALLQRDINGFGNHRLGDDLRMAQIDPLSQVVPQPRFADDFRSRIPAIQTLTRQTVHQAAVVLADTAVAGSLELGKEECIKPTQRSRPTRNRCTQTPPHEY